MTDPFFIGHNHFNLEPLPFPIRIPAVLYVTWAQGETRTQYFPFFFKYFFNNLDPASN